MTEPFEKNDLLWQHPQFLSSFGQWRAQPIVDSSESRPMTKVHRLQLSIGLDFVLIPRSFVEFGHIEY